MVVAMGRRRGRRDEKSSWSPWWEVVMAVAMGRRRGRRDEESS